MYFSKESKLVPETDKMHTEKTLCEDGRGQGDASKSGMPTIASNHQKLEERHGTDPFLQRS